MPKNKYPYKALHSQFLYLKGLLSSHGFTKQLKSGRESLVTPTYRAFCFIFHEYKSRYKVLQENQEGWLQLVMDDLNTRFEGWNSKGLEQAGLLLMQRHYKAGEATFKYRIPETILDGWDAAMDFSLDYYNYFSGEPWSEADEAALQEELERKWEGYPARMKKAADMFRGSYFNLTEVERHLSRLRRRLSKMPSDHPLYKAKLGELQNDEICFSALLAMNPIPSEYQSEKAEDDEFYLFQPRYQPATTGRIHMVGGALQTCTREMKLAAYGSLDEMHNYDLSSSQARILYHQEFKKYDIECPWLAEYLGSKEIRRGYARQISIQDAAWKECLSSLIMGAHLPTNTNNRNSSILKVLRAESQGNEEAVKMKLKTLREIIKPLSSALELWHNHLVEDIQQSGSLSNAMGISISLDSLPVKKPYKKIAAHILQGTEAYFIQELTLLAPKYGYKPIANEHDGIVVIGEISREAVEEARRLTGLRFMELEEKADFRACKL